MLQLAVSLFTGLVCAHKRPVYLVPLSLQREFIAIAAITIGVVIFVSITLTSPDLAVVERWGS